MLALAAAVALLNPDLEKLLAQGFLTLVFFFILAIFHAEQLVRPGRPATCRPGAL
jgi:hypothetical protein